MFEQGLPCWNGPKRLVHVELEWGVENEIENIRGLSNCEHIIKMRSPAGCVRLKKGS